MARSGPSYETFATLANDPDGDPIISVIAKRTYDIRPDGALAPAEEQLELVREEKYEERDDLPGTAPLAELDTFPFKVATDVVVIGKARAPGGRKVRELKVAVAVGDRGKIIHAFGDRKVEMAPGGAISFTEPEPFEEIDITYWNAFGGIDPSVVRPEPKTVLEILESMSFEDRPGAYARNPIGTGYVVNEERNLLDDLPLPNLEDPNDLLIPDRVVVRKPELWWQQPLPQGFGWFHQGWYPRMTFAGLIPHFPPPDDLGQFPEVRLGYVPQGQSRRLENVQIEEMIDFRLLNGASPGLIFPFLNGNETITLIGMDVEGERRLVLSGERPEIAIRFEKKILDVETRLHTVCVLKEENKLFLVWRGSARTPRVLPDKVPTLEDPMYDMLEGFDIVVDGDLYHHEPEPFEQESLF